MANNRGDCLEINCDPSEFWEMLTDYTHEEDFENNFNKTIHSISEQIKAKEQLPKASRKKPSIPERNISGLALYPLGNPAPIAKFTERFRKPDARKPDPAPAIPIRQQKQIKTKKPNQRGGKRYRLKNQIQILEKLIEVSTSSEEKDLHLQKLKETKNNLNRLRKGKIVINKN